MKERNKKQENVPVEKKKESAAHAKKLFETNMSMQVSLSRRINVLSFINGMILIAWSLDILIIMNK